MDRPTQQRYRNLSFIFSGEVEMEKATTEALRDHARAIGEMAMGDHSAQGNFMRRLSSAMNALSRGQTLSDAHLPQLMAACSDASLEVTLEARRMEMVASMNDAAQRILRLS